MKKILREAITITNNSIILTIPLIIFVKILDIYSMFSRFSIDTTPKFLIAFITVLCMFCAFFAGWFYMVKGAIEISKHIFVLDIDRTKATLGLFKKMLDGIGKFFLPFFGACLTYIFVIQVIAVQFVCLIGVKLIGSLDADSMENIHELTLSAAAYDNSAMAALIDNMTPEQIVFFGKWSLLFMIVTSVIMYILMLWFPEIVYNQKNAIKSLGISIAKLFRDFRHTFPVFITLWLIGFVILFINTFSIINPFVYLFINVIMFYFITYSAIAVFLYYDKTYGTKHE